MSALMNRNFWSHESFTFLSFSSLFPFPFHHSYPLRKVGRFGKAIRMGKYERNGRGGGVWVVVLLNSTEGYISLPLCPGEEGVESAASRPLTLSIVHRDRLTTFILRP